MSQPIEPRHTLLASLALLVPVGALGIVLVNLGPWTISDLNSSGDARSSSEALSEALARIILVTGITAAFGGFFRLLGHFEKTPLKPLDLLGKSLGFSAAAYASIYSVATFVAINGHAA